MTCLHIHIEGLVQGVGFRPFVYRLATEMQLTGWVSNGVDGVHIEIAGALEQLQDFIDRIQKDAPSIARITDVSIEETSIKHFEKFKIIESTTSGRPNLLITPDMGMCNACSVEIHDSENHRYNYPFTTCTNCGPRYSILKSLPYDRHTTTMNQFAPCARCEEEYYNPLNRRYYSQTNSCPECAIEAWLVNAKGERLADHWTEAFPILLDALAAGKIIAIKGIGGYLLMADATNYKAVLTLREQKHRPTKPFALMYPDVETLQLDTQVNAEEEAALTSPPNPIVLLPLKAYPASGICADEIAPGLNKIGAMLPYTAMFDMIMREWKKPVIATSGNVSGSPILYQDDEAFRGLHTVADLFLMHNREITIAQDDSVMQHSPVQEQPIVLRRSRGFAPTVSYPAFSNETTLAMGADMKSSFSLQANGRIYTSQYLGDLGSYESQESYKATLFHLLKLINVKPDRIVMDAHPQYFSTQLGKSLAEKWGIPVSNVQHHKAHAYAVLAENNLIGCHEPVLNVVWDGTGYGDDGNNWGGEFFEFCDGAMERIGHIAYAPVWQGDKMAQDGRLAALFFGGQSERVRAFLQPKFSDVVWLYYEKLLHTKSDLYTSSVGRLFDAVACLTAVNLFNLYEGESAMKLEALASHGHTAVRYHVRWKDTTLDTENLLNQIVLDLKEGIRPEKIAFKFHAWLADAIHSVVESKDYRKIALSGGVFQNALLIDLVLRKLKDKQVLLHKELSPNDENISFGQLAYASQEVEQLRVKAKIELILNRN
jgi:hydrogenase maturation protein HypF